MKTINRTIQTTVTPTPEELADVWCDMDAQQQAQFFNEMSEESKTWPMPFCFQLQSILDTGILTQGGSHVMDMIGNYAYNKINLDKNQDVAVLVLGQRELELLNYLHQQFPATIGHIPLAGKIHSIWQQGMDDAAKPNVES